MDYPENEVYYSILPRGEEEDKHRILATRTILKQQFANREEVLEALDEEEEHFAVRFVNGEKIDDRLFIKTPKDIAEELRDMLIETEGKDVMAEQPIAIPKD